MKKMKELRHKIDELCSCAEEEIEDDEEIAREMNVCKPDDEEEGAPSFIDHFAMLCRNARIRRCARDARRGFGKGGQ